MDFENFDNCGFMSGVAEIGASMMKVSERRLEGVSQNVSNVQTPGYQSVTSFQTELKSADVDSVFAPSAMMSGLLEEMRDARQGELKASENILDFALSGHGLFGVRDTSGESDVFTLTRNGRFEIGQDGHVVDALGRRLQSVEGRDLKVSSVDSLSVGPDGIIFENDRPIDRIGVFAPSSIEGGLTALTPSLSDTDFELRQGMIEASNVSLPNEMIEMMEAVRQAETGSRIIQTYDTLMGQAISAFGQG